ncbi:MAG: hypothetical protein IT379_05515 [Deltaproteobacteria bacterium]|nr:hypothetical protein [Deltaproteobacteria bacterium]
MGDRGPRSVATCAVVVVLTWLAGSAPAFADVAAGPEHDLAAPARGAGPGDQRDPAVACGDVVCLVVWSDGRAGEGASDIWATRVDRNGGRVLDPVGIALALEPGRQTHPSVAFDGDGFVVVWSEERPAGASAGVVVTHVSEEGRVLATRAISRVAGDGQPDVVRARDGALVVWRRGSSVGRILLQAALVAGTTTVLGPVVWTSTDDVEACAPPAFDGEGHWLVCSHGLGERRHAIRAVHFGPDLSLSGGAPIELGTTGAYDAPALLAGEGRESSLIVWSEDHGDRSTLMTRRIARDGRLLDDAPVEASGNGRPWLDAVSELGNAWLIVWTDELDPSDGEGSDWRRFAFGVRVAQTDGRAVGPEVRIGVGADGQNDCALGTWADGALLAWGAYPARVQGARLTLDAAPLDESALELGAAAAAQFRPAVAAGHERYLVAWTEGGADIYSAAPVIAMTAVSADGSPSEVAPARFGEPSWFVGAPAIASDGEGFLVVWQRMRDRDEWGGHQQQVVAVRVDAAGSVQDQAPFVLTDEHGADWGPWLNDPLVAFDGERYLVVWTYYGMDLDGTSGRHVGRDGSVAGADLPEIGYWSSYEEPWLLALVGLAASRDGALLVASSGRGLYGVLYAHGARRDPVPRRVLDIGGVSALAGSDDGFLFLLGQSRSDEDSPVDLEFQRLDAGGNALTESPVGLVRSIMRPNPPAVVHDGRAWLVAWTPRRDAASPGGILAARAGTSGRALDREPLTLTGGTTAESNVALASIRDGSSLLVYTRLDPDPPYGTVRVRVRRVDDDAAVDTDGEPVSTGDEEARKHTVGCGCRVAGSSQDPTETLALTVLLALVARSRSEPIRRGPRTAAMEAARWVRDGGAGFCGCSRGPARARAVACAVDRFIDAAHDLVVEGESYRSRLKPAVRDHDPPPAAPIAKKPTLGRRRR